MNIFNILNIVHFILQQQNIAWVPTLQSVMFPWYCNNKTPSLSVLPTIDSIQSHQNQCHINKQTTLKSSPGWIYFVSQLLCSRHLLVLHHPHHLEWLLIVIKHESKKTNKHHPHHLGWRWDWNHWIIELKVVIICISIKHHQHHSEWHWEIMIMLLIVHQSHFHQSHIVDIEKSWLYCRLFIKVTALPEALLVLHPILLEKNPSCSSSSSKKQHEL